MGTFGGITFNGVTMVGSGSNFSSGAGLAIRGRSDVAGASATTLSTVTVTNATIDGSQIAIAIGYTVNGVSISKADIRNVGAQGVVVYPVGTASPTAVTISNSAFANSAAPALVNTTSSAVNASGNWWGSNVEATVAGRITGITNVDFNAYLGTGTNAVATGPGFQGEFSNIYVTTLGTQIGGTGRVQEGVNLATIGGTVTVNPGLYTDGEVTVNAATLTVNVPTGVAGFTGLLLGEGVARGALAGTGAVDLVGNAEPNELAGNDGPNGIRGEGDDDELTGHGDDDTIDGGTGLDTAVYSGDYADYTVTVTGSGPEAVITVVDDRPERPDGTDALTNVERLRFADRTVNPFGLTLAITSSTSTLKAGETAEIAFLLSDSSTDFTAADVLVTGGTLSNFGGAGVAYTAIFTPAPGFVGTATVTVPAGSFTDDVGTPNAESVLAPPITIDTLTPTLVITASAATIRHGQSVTLAFALSEPAIGFEAAVVEVTGGTLAGFARLTSTAYTAVFTPLAEFAGTGTVVVPAGAFTDAAGNPNLAASLAPALEIDTIQPTVLVTSDRGTLARGRTAVVTFALSQPAPGFSARNVDVSGGSIGPLTAVDATTYTGLFTPTPSFRGQGTVNVAAAAFTGVSGNPNLPGGLAAPLAIATQQPSVTIVADAVTLLSGQAAGLTFVLDTPSSDFTADAVVVTNGTLTGFTGAGDRYTATFVPTRNFRGTGTVAVHAAAFRDAFGNRNLAGSLKPELAVDTVRPRVRVTASRGSLTRGESATIGFSLSQPSTTFTLADVVVTGGTLQNFTGSGRQYTATFKPGANLVGPGTIDVPAGSFVGDTGNPNSAGGLATPLAIDTARPQLTITSDRPALARGQTATIEFVVSRPTASFRASQVVVAGGSLSNFNGSGTRYTALFTPRADFVGTATVSVPAGVFRSTAGNLNAAGTIAAPISVETVRPSVRITTSAASLRAGQAAVVTFALTRPSTSFTVDDVTVRGGTLAGFTGSGTVYTAVFTPRADFAGSGTIEVAARAFTSTAGNTNVAGRLVPPLSIETIQPTVTITAQRTSLRAGATTRLSFALDRPSTEFGPNSIALTGGTLSQFQGSGQSYTGIFTPLADFTGAGTVTVPAAAFRSSSGNANRFSALATPLVIDTVRPSVTISSSRTALGAGETATITFLLGRPSADFTAAAVTVRGGTLSALAGSGSSYTATFTPQAGFRGQGTIGVEVGSFTGPTGSRNRAGSLAVPIEIDTLAAG